MSHMALGWGLAERALSTHGLVDWQGTPPKGRQVFKGQLLSPEGTSQEIASGNLRFLKSWACPTPIVFCWSPQWGIPT